MNDGRPVDDAVLILGNGYLAGFLAPLTGNTVIAVSRRGRTDAGPARVTHVAADLFEPAQVPRWQRAARDKDRHGMAVYVLLPPSALGDRNVDTAMPGLVRAVDALQPSIIVVASSSGVYDGIDDDVVTPDTHAPGRTPRAARLLTIEQHWQAAAAPVCIVRLAGLYGPRRVIGLGALERGESLPGRADAWLNLIHAEDAATALHEAARRRLTSSLLLSDGHPCRRGDYYAAVAAARQLAPPHFDTQAPRRGGSRRIDPAASWAALALQPVYTDACATAAELARITRE